MLAHPSCVYVPVKLVCVCVCVLSDSKTGTVCVLFVLLLSSSEALDEAAGKQARLPRPLQGAFVPAVFPLLMDEHHVSFPQLDLRLALGRVGHHHAIPATHGDSYNTHGAADYSARWNGPAETI